MKIFKNKNICSILFLLLNVFVVCFLKENTKKGHDANALFVS